MTAENDILQVTLLGTDANGEDMRNVFFYAVEAREGATDDVTDEMALLFGANTAPGIAQIMDGGSLLHGVEVINLFNPAELASITISVNGFNPSENDRSFVAAAFRTSRVRRDIRRGQKRFGGLGESMFEGNSLNPAYDGLVVNTANALSATLFDPGDPTIDLYVPIVVKRVKVSDGSGGFTYRLPITQLEAEYFVADSWEFVGPTTQRTRKA